MELGYISFILRFMIYFGLGLPLINVLLGAVFSSGDTDVEVDVDSGMDVDVEMDVDFDVDAGGGLDLSASTGMEADVDLDLDVDLDTDLDVDLDPSDLAVKGKVAVSGGKGLLQFNMNCLCLGFVVMGAWGTYGLGKVHTMVGVVLVLAISFALAFAAYSALYILLVRRLKQNDASALNMKSLLHQHALVEFRITQDSPGKIIAKDSVGAVISYLAELDKDVCDLERIEEGEEVMITDIDRKTNICYVTLAERKILK